MIGREAVRLPVLQRKIGSAETRGRTRAQEDLIAWHVHGCVLSVSR
jgi:hypothetical protein